MLTAILMICGAALLIGVGTTTILLTRKSGTTLGPKWPKSALPIFIVSDPSAAEWKTEIEAGIALWSDVSLGLLLCGGEMPASEATGPIVSISVVTSPANASSELHGVTRYEYTSTGEILSAKVELPAETPPYLRARVVAHELGHVLSLGHEDSESSVMYRYAIRGPYSVSSADRSTLKQIYNLR